MLLKDVVVHVIGDLTKDAFIPAAWHYSDVERYCKGKLKLATELTKAVTHVVCSRESFSQAQRQGTR